MAISIPPLTPELLSSLGADLGGCAFDHESQTRFLSCAESCDVHAAPGNGKTTLIVAKLALLSQCWSSRNQGVCVISHTNAARDEVQKRLTSHPTASAFLAYPHFIGTVTSFIDRFIALPYLRGLRWPVHCIDDDVFEAVARSSYAAKPTLRKAAFMNRHGVETWVSRLELAPDSNWDAASDATRLKVQSRVRRQPRETTKSGIELEELKAELVSRGFYRFGDMIVIAEQALQKCLSLTDRLRRRFPLVILDEAQDTHGAQLRLLNRLFAEGVAFQRLGDQNQTLYEEREDPTSDYWQAGAGAIPLDHSRRFGAGIAAFASRLTVRRRQQIEGLAKDLDRRSLILFNKPSIGGVLPAYAAEVRAHWDVPTTAHEIWAVASRHSQYREVAGSWPKSLVDYCPGYRPAGAGNRTRDSFCAGLRRASLLWSAHACPASIMDLITVALVDLLRNYECEELRQQKVNVRNLWRVLGSYRLDLPVKLRRLIVASVLRGRATWNPEAWAAFHCALCTELGAALQLTPSSNLADFLAFDDASTLDPDAQTQQQSTSFFRDGNVTVRLSSIHGVKGRTVHGILVVETEVRLGQALSERAMDLTEVLPHALGIVDRNFTSAAQLTAATNVFVAVTRPRQLLTCAVRKETTSESLLNAALEQGWHVIDLTAHTPSGEAT